MAYAGRKHICQLAKAGRGWPRLEAALRVFWRRRGVLEGELADASGGLPFHIAPLAFEVLRVGRLGLGVGRRAEDVVQEVARHLRVLEQDVRVVDRHLGERYEREIERRGPKRGGKLTAELQVWIWSLKQRTPPKLRLRVPMQPAYRN